jgi:predicted nucleotidyltransferase
MLDLQDLRLRPNHQAFLNRFVEACQADQRVVAAFLGGSYAKGYADAYSDLDLSVITTDQSFEEFFNEREAFLRLLGELVFLEDFDIPDIAFYIFADDTEGELYFGSESRLDHIHSGPFRVLIDKKNILTEAIFSEREPASSKQMEKLRGFIYGFWHELSHFITALQRGQLWWARGQLEALRSICVNLARLRHNFSDADTGEEAYFKIETVMPVEQLSALQETFCPMEKKAMLAAVVVIVHFYQNLAPSLAQQHGIKYPQGLERVMTDRLQKLQDAHPHGDGA